MVRLPVYTYMNQQLKNSPVQIQQHDNRCYGKNPNVKGVGKSGMILKPRLGHM